MSDFLQQDYDFFISQKLKKGNYTSVIEKFDSKNRQRVIEMLLELSRSVEPTLDKEFMERVGDKVVKLQEKADGKL